MLEMMRITMHSETFIGDDTAFTDALCELKSRVLGVKKLYDPDMYYNEVRPWFRGEDSFNNRYLTA